MGRATLLWRKTVKAGGDERKEGLRDVERVDRPDDVVLIAALLEQTAVEQHPHRLDRIQRYTLRGIEHLETEVLRETRDEAIEKLFHGDA